MEYILYTELPKQPARPHLALCLRQWKDTEWVVHEVDINLVNKNPNHPDVGYLPGSYHNSLKGAVKNFQERLQTYMDQYAEHIKV